MHRLKPYVLPLLPVLALIFVWTAWANWVLRPRLFRKAVLDPIPPSVRKIKGSASSGPDGHKYVLRFDISEADVQLILASDQFKEIGYVWYSANSILHFGETSETTSSFMLFGDWSPKRPPRWFRFADWKAFKGYLVEEEKGNYFYKARLLVYNPDLGQAYFVEYEACL